MANLVKKGFGADHCSESMQSNCALGFTLLFVLKINHQTIYLVNIVRPCASEQMLDAMFV